MGRLGSENPVPGYAPLLRISLRRDPEGGPVLDEVVEEWTPKPGLPQHELLVLVHGYNNHQKDAEGAYAALRSRQGGLLGDEALKARLEARLGDAFWPGDAKWPGLIDKLDFLFYPKAVTVAKDVGPKIAKYLRGRTDVKTVHFLGHSLGCRVVLETISALDTDDDKPAVGKVCLMAAAVPTFMVCPGGRLRSAVLKSGTLRVLFSPDDIVLSVTFPAGQTLAEGNEGFFPAAVGHAGDIPITPGKVDREQIPGAGHGDYWGQSKGQPPELSAKAVFDFFRFDGLGSRTLQERPLPPGRPMPPERDIAESI